MDFPLLKDDWTNPIPNERRIYKTKVIEVFGTRIALLFLIIFILIVISFLTGFYFLLLFPNIVFIIGFPLFIAPWDIVLSDKRLILRKRYWFSGRFSTVKSVNLLQLEGQRFSPRLKIIPLTLGFLIIESFSLLLIEYSFTNSPPIPLLLEIAILIGSFFDANLVQNSVNDLILLLFPPLFPISLLTGIITLVMGLLLIFFGLPYRTNFEMSLASGHVIKINAGVPKALPLLIFSVSRLKTVHTKINFWKWKLPLLKDEKVITSAKVALVNHKSQFIGFLSLYIVIISLSKTLELFSDPNSSNSIILGIYLINFVIIIFALRFAKRYRHIVATNERLLFQDEYSSVSGVWGKRIYQYSDLPLKFIKGYRISNFTYISFFSILSIIITAIAGVFLAIELDNPDLITYFFLFSFALLIYNYKIHTSFQILTIGGKKIEVSYSIPLGWKLISNLLEERTRFFNFLFYDVLTEQKISEICKSIRKIPETAKDKTSYEKTSFSIENFLQKNEKIIFEWKRIKPLPFLKESLILGSFMSLVVLVVILGYLPVIYRGLFIILSLVLITIIWIQSLIIISRSLIVTEKRIFFIRELIPKRIAIFLGRMPEWTIIESTKENIEIMKLKYYFPVPKNLKSGRFFLVLIVLSLGFLFQQDLIGYLPLTYVHLITFLTGLLIVLLFPIMSRSFVNYIPRYSLVVHTRFDIIEMPYIKNTDKIKLIFDT